MASESITLYKLMVLYMLKRVNFPLTNAQMSEFFLDKDYTDYFTFQEVLNDLLEANLISMETVRNASRYEITREGVETLGFFGSKLSAAVTADMESFLKENKFKLRSEVGVTADYYKSTTQEYVVHCEVREGRSMLVELNLAVPDEEQARSMCGRWQGASQEIYAYVMKKLMA
ncbi:DUF4364 family protein [Cuneatibacter caecimuris]|uniref:Uncharacterized protein DUF4364 n=1 Tax=Cuneatibacter caecimuris TaxID=1796618 RepID=A0A4Q7NY74_9FIRM|nr:DUF4364 family protein [Cuneatibacter caecimuris]RZS92363.1 uncharacterized protein DUF4364 [Cuneatibacter caecimuris]